MSPSPSVCSPTYVLSNTPQESATDDYFNLARTRVASQADYFAKSVSRHSSKNILSRRHNDSVSSLNSDGTVVDHPYKRITRNDSENSTNTLVDDAPSTKPHITLSFPGLTLEDLDETTSLSVPQPSSVEMNTPTRVPQPLLIKQLTSPTLKTFQEVKLRKGRQEQENYRELISKLYQNIEYINHTQLNTLLSKVEVVDPVRLPNLVTIDIRSFTDFVKGHIKHSLNICLPSTLLKRPNFSFTRCINSLPLYDKMIFKTYFNFKETNHTEGRTLDHLADIPCSSSGFPAIFIYDNTSFSPNIYFMLKKIVDFFKDINTKIYLLDESFSTIPTFSAEFLETGNTQHFDLNKLIENDTNVYKDILINTSPTRVVPAPDAAERLRSASLNELPTVKSLTLTSSPLVEIIDSSTPLLAKFQLPSIEKKFCIRHNEEVFDDNIDFHIDIARYDSHRGDIPDWLYNAAKDSAYLSTKFNILEKIEKARLNTALSIGPQSKASTDIDETIDTLQEIPVISSGIEFGHKNRYKDIFVYEHSRVKLWDLDTPQMCDYINASYINSIDGLKMTEKISNQDYTFIASQAPMEHTIGDFWKCIINNNCYIIITLSNEVENGVVKCEPFWKSNTYTSNNNKIHVTLKAEQAFGNIRLRRVVVNIDGRFEREVMQIQLMNWFDNQICESFHDLIEIVQLRSYLVKQLDIKEYSTLAHCSAGCGRTGTFIALDTLICLTRNNVKIHKDIIPKLINNLRKQRISMVQNVRQFCSVYEMYMGYFISKDSELCDSQIVNDFIVGRR